MWQSLVQRREIEGSRLTSRSREKNWSEQIAVRSSPLSVRLAGTTNGYGSARETLRVPSGFFKVGWNPAGAVPIEVPLIKQLGDNST